MKCLDYSQYILTVVPSELFLVSLISVEECSLSVSLQTIGLDVHRHFFRRDGNLACGCHSSFFYNFFYFAFLYKDIIYRHIFLIYNR